MVRLTFYIILALFFAFGAAWISSNPGQVLITWQGWEVRFSIAVFIMLAIFYFLIIWSVLKLYKWLNIATYLGNPKRLAAKRQKANLDLDHAWSAYALGDYKEAIKFALRAKSKLGEDHNILRLLASATEASGETNNPYLETLGKSPQSAPWVQKQQLDHYIQDKSWEAALPLVNSMLETHTSNGYLLKMAFLLLARLGKWPESYQALQNALQVKGAIVPSEKGHLKAVIEYCLALEKKAGGQKTESHALLKAALKNDSSFAPAALLSAQLYIEQNDKKSAEKTLAAIWKKTQNKDLADMIADLNPQESANETFRRIKKITDTTPKSFEANHLLAKVAISAEHWPDAEAALTANINSNTATKTTYELLALLERRQKNDEEAAQKYLTLSDSASADGNWTCTECKTDSTHFLPLCPNCREFDKITWV